MTQVSKLTTLHGRNGFTTNGSDPVALCTWMAAAWQTGQSQSLEGMENRKVERVLELVWGEPSSAHETSLTILSPCCGGSSADGWQFMQVPDSEVTARGHQAGPWQLSHAINGRDNLSPSDFASRP